MKSYWRNIFAFEDEEEEWRKELECFPNRVPRFDGKEEAVAFTKQHCLHGSNPQYSQLQHSISTLIDWAQIETILIPKIREYEKRWPSSLVSIKRNTAEAANIDSMDEMKQSIHDYASSRLNLPIHATMCEISRMNTLRYLFFHMKCGIYVMIRRNQVAIFCPFVNKDYTNTWADTLAMDTGAVKDNTVVAYQENKIVACKVSPPLVYHFQYW
jgi:hypothetical protein